jgi:hypothetical protein
MKSNTHVQAIDEKTMQAIMGKMDEIQRLLDPFITALTPTERKTLPKMGEKTLAFVEKCHEFAIKNTEFCPPFLDMNLFSIDFKDAHGLFGAVNRATQIQEGLADTQMCAGSEAYQAALLFYHSVKSAAANDIAGAKAVYEELRKRFPHPGRRPGNAGGDTPKDGTGV